jgi:lipid II:glycine glycyltransferase (peptidoglycan interpeptide bridge formation enzyme)
MLVEVHEIRDPAAWNAMVLSLPAADLEQGWEWGDVLAHTGWQIHRHAVTAGGACVGAAAIASRHLAGLGAVLYASRGPLVRVKEDDAWTGLMQAIENVAERTGAIFLRVSPGIRQDFALHDRLLGHRFRHLPDDWTTWNAPRIVLHLDLDADEAELYRRVRKTTRQEGSSARRRGVVVRPARDPGDLTRLHRLLVAMGNAKGYPVRGVERLRQLWEKYVARGQGTLLMAEHEGDVLGGLLAVRFGERAYFQYATVKRDVAAQRLHPGPLLCWEFVRWAKAEGCETIDWGGSGTRYPPCPADPGYGVYRFKRSFGCTLSRGPGYYDLVFKPRLYHAWRLAERYVLPIAWRLRGRFNGRARRLVFGAGGRDVG